MNSKTPKVQIKPNNQNDTDSKKQKEIAERLKDLRTGNQRNERGFLSALLDKEKVTPEGFVYVPQTHTHAIV